MVILQIEHSILNYNAWKQAFEKDPLNRKASGVRSYKIIRPTDNEKYLFVWLEFDNVSSAEAMIKKLHALFKNGMETIMMRPKIRLLQLLEQQVL